MSKNIKTNKSLEALKVILNRYYKIVNVALFIAVLVVGYIYLLSPRIKEIRESINSFIPEKKEEIEILNEYYSKIDALEEKVSADEQKYQKDIQKIKQILPTASELPELMIQLDRLATASGFTFPSIEMSEAYVDSKSSKSKTSEIGLSDFLSDLRIVNISLNVQGGGYEDFKRLLDNIEKHIRILDLTTMSFSAPSKTEGGNYSLNLRTYYLPE